MQTPTTIAGSVFCLCAFLLALAAVPRMAEAAPSAAENDGTVLRFYQGATAYVVNPDGGAFDVAVDVQQWHLLENGPRELLIKIYDPEGKVIVRKLAEDDGVKGNAFMPEAGGWDHEMWYYTLCYSRGSQPMFRWSAFTEAGRLAAIPKQSFKFNVPAGPKGVYRVLMAGSRDHVATLRVSRNLKVGLAGHPNWMHGHGDMFKKSYVYVPKGTVGINLGFAEYDQPITRNFKLTAADGTVLWDNPARGGFQSKTVKIDPGKYDDQLITVEVSEGAGDYMLAIQFSRTDIKPYRGLGGAAAVYAADPETAKAIQGGAIYHDGQVFWHGFQVRLHEWMKANLKPEDMIVRNAKGEEIKPTEGKSFGFGAKVMEYKDLPKVEGFVTLNGPHEAPPLCDQLMHNYQAHKNRAILNVAIADLAIGLRELCIGDVPCVAGWNGNMGYLFGTYGYHYWRPAWRILQQSEAPAELKAIVHEAILLGGDRIAMSAGLERTNGNALSHIPMALRYAAEGTKDPFLTKLSDTYFERFVNQGWGRGVGISKSGDCQEHFAHDFHYGTYIHDNYTAVVNDLKDEKFKAVLARLSELYSYLYCPEAAAYPWGSRTNAQAGLGKWNWKGKPGPDFTVSVNGGDEWFAARRPTYYALTFHGRLCPEWLNNYFATRLGYGGGILCQVAVPDKGVVIASTLNGSYGGGMERANWRNFAIHAIVGTMADGQPLVAADSEHLDAKLKGNTVTGSGEIRDRPLRSTRSYTFNADHIAVSAQLADTDFRAALWNQGPSSKISEAFEMIPIISSASLRVADAEGKIVELGKEATMTNTLIIDRKDFGVRIDFDQQRSVKRGNRNAIMVQIADKVVTPDKVAIAYTITPYVGAAPAAVPTTQPAATQPGK